jgi:hypothetical protein
MNPFKALLVEGTSGVGKSTLIDALIRRHVASTPPRKLRSLIHLAQAHTDGPLAGREDRGTLTVANNLQHLDRITGTLEWLHHCVQEHSKAWCFVIVDTLHLTHCVRPGVVQWADVVAIDGRLAALGCKLLSLQASPQMLWERGIGPRVKDQFLVEYAKKFGQTNEEIHAHFVREQETLGRLFSKSAMTKRLIGSNGAFDAAVDGAYRFWMEDPADVPAHDIGKAS